MSDKPTPMPDKPTFVDRVAQVIYDVLEGPVNNQDAARQARQWELSLQIARAVIIAIAGEDYVNE